MDILTFESCYVSTMDGFFGFTPKRDTCQPSQTLQLFCNCTKLAMVADLKFLCFCFYFLVLQKVMFSQVSVILFTRGSGVADPPWQTPQADPSGQTPPWAYQLSSLAVVKLPNCTSLPSPEGGDYLECFIPYNNDRERRDTNSTSK